MSGVPPGHFPSYFLETGSLTEPKPMLGASKPSSPAFYLGASDLISGLGACTASAVPTVPVFLHWPGALGDNTSRLTHSITESAQCVSSR